MASGSFPYLIPEAGVNRYRIPHSEGCFGGVEGSGDFKMVGWEVADGFAFFGARFTIGEEEYEVEEER